MARDQSKLHPILQYKVKQLINLCEVQGLKIGIGECFRTVAEQEALYAKGRTDKSSGIVTNCRGITYSSPHQWGIAFDFYLLMDIDGDGKTKDDAYNDKIGTFRRVGKLAESIGLEWGGDWHSFVDKPHIQLPYWGSTTSRLKAKYGTPDKFDNYWYPNQPINTVKAGSPSQDVLWLQIQLCKVTNVNLVIDGVWGKQTATAVYNYQESLGWNPTGEAGSKTIMALGKGRIK